MFSLKANFRVLRPILSGHLDQLRKLSSLSSPECDLQLICSELNKQCDNVIYSYKENGSLRVQLNNTRKKNAMNLQMYQSIGQALKIASDNEKIKCVIFRGNEGFYSSGNDLSKI